MSIDPVVFLLAACIAVFVAFAVGTVVRPTRMIGWRVRPYAQLSRTRMGRGADAVAVIELDGGLPDGVPALLFRFKADRVIGKPGHALQ